MDKPFTFDRVIRILLTILIIGGLLWVVDSLSSVLIPFFLAILLAYFIDPIVNWVQKKIKKRIGAVLITLLGLFILLSVLFSILIPVMAKEVNRFSELLSAYSSQFTPPEWLPPDLIKELEGQFQALDYKEVLSQEGIGEMIKNALGSVWGFVTGVFGFIGSLVGLVTLILYLVFILIDYRSISEGWKAFLPPKYKQPILSLFTDVENGMNAYFKAQSKIVLSVAIMFAIGFKLIGLPMGILLGLFVGLLNYVPYLQTAGFIPATFLALLHCMETGMNFWVMFGLVVLVFVVVQLVQDAFLTPKIMGDMTGLNPAVMLLSLSVWGSWLGLLGMIIALPMTTLLISYYKRFILNGNALVAVPDEEE